jgi:shikimate kinase
MEGRLSVIVSLIGYRGTGKTTVGMLLAERLGWKCMDTDEQIQERAGCSIRQLFEQQGEAAFRDLESAVIAECVRGHRVVLSLGGGAILRSENRQRLSVAGPVVWLMAEPSVIRQRLQADPRSWTQRPALLAADSGPASSGSPAAADEIDRVLAERLPIYESCADVRVATDDKTPTEIVEAILAALDLQPERGLS